MRYPMAPRLSYVTVVIFPAQSPHVFAGAWRDPTKTDCPDQQKHSRPLFSILVPVTGFERDVVMASGLIPNGSEDSLIHLLGVLEIVLGMLIVAGVWLRPLCLVQAAVVGFFTVVIPLTHPPTLAHPFGLLSKNVPILGAIAALWFLSGAAVVKCTASKPSNSVELT